MNTIRRTHQAPSFILLSLACALSPGSLARAQDDVVVRPEDTGAVLVNPQMGWVLHFYDNVIEHYGSRLAPSDTADDFPGISVIYLRLPWSYLEPEEGKFTWSMVDAPAQRWIDKGKQVAFRFTCSESWMRYATPKWVQDAGAKGYDFTPGKGVVDGGRYWEPDFADPVFLEKLDAFLSAAATRYDGNPNVSFVDIGSIGVWGEGHTFHSSQRKYSPEVIRTHIDLHLKHFRRTLLAANDDLSFMGEETIDYALEKGLTLRDDSICVQPPPQSWFHADMAGKFWPRLPIVLETEHYGSSKQRGAWGDGSLFVKSVEDYHASLVSIHWWPREFLKEQREVIEKINLRMGYRLQLREASWPKAIATEGPVTFRSAWANAGVAPCYPGGHVAWTLKDSEGGIVAVLVDETFDVRALEVGAPEKAPTQEVRSVFRAASNLKPGTFSVWVSVGSRDGTPRIALPLSRDDGHRRYALGEIVVQ